MRPLRARSIARVARTNRVLVSAATNPAKDFQALIANLKKRKGETSFASFGTGTASHYAGLILSNQAGIGRVNLYRGRWHWVCDEPAEVQTFYNAVGEHLISDKKKMIEVAWTEWRRQTLETTEGEQDPGSIDGPLYPELQQDDDIAP